MGVMDYRKNLELDLRAMFKFVMKKWRLIVIFMIAGVIIGGISGYKKMKDGLAEQEDVVAESDIATTAQIEEVKIISLDELRNKLSESDIVQIENTADQYVVFVRRYLELQEYYDSSIYFKLDGYHIPVQQTIFKVSAEDDRVIDKNDLTDVVTTCSRELLKTESLNRISNAVNGSITATQLKELIRVQTYANNQILVEIFGLDDDVSNLAMKCIETIINDTSGLINITYGFDISKLYTVTTVRSDATLLAEQRDYVGNLYNTKNYMKVLGGTLADGQTPYYTAIRECVDKVYLSDDEEAITIRNSVDTESARAIADEYTKNRAVTTSGHVVDDNSGLIEDSTSAETDNNEVSDEQKTASYGVEVIIKGLILGAILGALLVIMILCIKYAMSSKLHTADDMRNTFKVPVIGELSADGNVDLTAVVSMIDLAGSREGFCNICIVGSSKDESTTGIRHRLKDELEKADGVTAAECDGAFTDMDSMNKLGAADAVILVERIEESEYEKIAREIEVCRNCGVDLLGSVVVV